MYSSHSSFDGIKQAELIIPSTGTAEEYKIFNKKEKLHREEIILIETARFSQRSKIQRDYIDYLEKNYALFEDLQIEMLNNLRTISQKYNEIFGKEDQTSIEYNIHDFDIKSIEYDYDLKDILEIKAFLIENPQVISFLKFAKYIIKDYFKSTKLILEIMYDPNEDWKELVVWITTNLSPEKASDILTEFDRNWWFEKSKTLNCTVTINLDFE